MQGCDRCALSSCFEPDVGARCPPGTSEQHAAALWGFFPHLGVSPTGTGSSAGRWADRQTDGLSAPFPHSSSRQMCLVPGELLPRPTNTLFSLLSRC